MVDELPGHTVVEPLTVAVGNGWTVIAALPDEVPVHVALETTVTV
jgi:hypothetical protein